MEKLIKASWLILFIYIAVIALTSCGTMENGQSQSTGISYNKEELEKAITIIVLTESDDINKELFSDNFQFNSYDKEAITYEDDYKVYFSNNAIYLQVNMSMYRFQIGKDGKILEYIKYSVQA